MTGKKTTDKRTGTAKDDDNRRFTFKAIDRLPDSPAFSRVFRGASKSRDNLFTVLSRANGKECARLGLAISKKHCRAASGRNRLKRIVRESFRHHQAALPAVDIVVLGQSGTSRADNQALFASLAGHWRNIRSEGS